VLITSANAPGCSCSAPQVKSALKGSGLAKPKLALDCVSGEQSRAEQTAGHHVPAALHTCCDGCLLTMAACVQLN